jgi:hypothetical protein
VRLLHFLFLLAVAAEITVPALVGLPMIAGELDRGIALANVAATAESLFFAEAEEVYQQVRSVLPRIDGLTPGDHEVLVTKVTDLRMALELVPGAMDRRHRPPSFMG